MSTQDVTNIILDASGIVNSLLRGTTHTWKLLCNDRGTFVPSPQSPRLSRPSLTLRDSVSLHCRLIPHSSVISERSSSSNSSRLMSWVSLLGTETKITTQGV